MSGSPDSSTLPQTPRPSAGVVLLRDGPDGLEVFMVQRNRQLNVLGGAHVFPGGKLDAGDTDPALLERLGAPMHALHDALGEPDIAPGQAAGLYLAACRETFEEVGVLLAATSTPAQRRELADQVRAGLAFGHGLARLGLRLSWDALVPWTRWITPDSPDFVNKRFDARFFLAAAPEGQEALHDDNEAVASVWAPPRVLLERCRAGAISLVPAQMMSLATLARQRTAAAALADAASRPPPRIPMHATRHESLRAVVLPGDPLHPLAGRVLPGPTRLVVRNGRFEPVTGFDEFYD